MPFTINQINAAIGNIHINAIDRIYLDSYREVITYFTNIEQLNKSYFLIGTHLVYAWMPTKLKLYIQDEDFENILEILNGIKHGNNITVEQLISLKNTINHSLVGTSKLLHCLNPNKFAIWDSRVYKFINGTISQYQLNQPRNYFEYLENCIEVVANEIFPTIHEEINREIGYPVSNLRAIEWIMYKNGDN